MVGIKISHCNTKLTLDEEKRGREGGGRRGGRRREKDYVLSIRKILLTRFDPYPNFKRINNTSSF
jgi:hypothetical protein